MPSRAKSRQGYDDYINSGEWANKKEEIAKTYAIHGWDASCLKCGRSNSLQVHHNYYIKNQYLGRENISDLDYLCTNCHNAWHLIQKASGKSQNESLQEYNAFITDNGTSPRTKHLYAMTEQKVSIDDRAIAAYFSRSDVIEYRKFNTISTILFVISFLLVFLYLIGILTAILTIIFICKKQPDDYDLFSEKQIPLNRKKYLLDNRPPPGQPPQTISPPPIAATTTAYYREALYYYDMGFNMTFISPITNQYNSKAENTFLKAPAHAWEHLTGTRQSRIELDSYAWKEAHGFGIVTGFNGLVVLDMDNGTGAFLEETLNALSLPVNYSWVVKSGNQHGFHVYFFLPELQHRLEKTTVVRLLPKLAYQHQIEKVELLLKLHAILPPSLHPSGGRYAFLQGTKPKTGPAKMSIHLLDTYIEKYFDVSKTIKAKCSKTTTDTNSNHNSP